MSHHPLAAPVVASVVRVAGLASLVALAGACTKSAPAAPPKEAPEAKAKASGPEWFDEVVDEAFMSARKTGRVVFVDAWAPWCHTCLSMQRDVLNDPALKKYEDRVVFASIDTDKPESASFVARFPLKSWPTFFVIDPAADVALGEHGGSLSLAELQHFIEESLRSTDAAVAAEPQVKELLLGHAAAAKKDWAGAAAHYAAAAAVAGPRAQEAALGAMRTFNAAKDDAGCIDFAVKGAPAVMQTSSSAGDFASYALTCAQRTSDAALKAKGLQQARAMLDRITSAPPAGASVDDRADALATLADVAQEQGDEASFKSAHEKRLKLLEDDAAAHKDIEGQRVHDYARMNSYIALGRGDEAVKLFRLRTQQLPTSYEPWARLASALHQLKREDEALPAAQKAVELSYGPRRLRYLTLLADIYAARGDHAAEKKALAQLVDEAEKLPPGHRDAAAVATAKERMAKLTP